MVGCVGEGEETARIVCLREVGRGGDVDTGRMDVKGVDAGLHSMIGTSAVKRAFAVSGADDDLYSDTSIGTPKCCSHED